jgi:hypothetical protein
MEILITSCDLCNIDGKLHNPYRLPTGLVEALGMEGQADDNGEVWVNRGVYVGASGQAIIEECWEETDYGTICNLCVFDQKGQDSDDCGSAGLSAIDSGVEIDYDEIVKGPK